MATITVSTTSKIILSDELLKAAQELRDRIEAHTGIRSTVNVQLWWPPSDSVVLDKPESWDSWKHEKKEDGPDTDIYSCHQIRDARQVYVTLYTSEYRQDGLLEKTA